MKFTCLIAIVAASNGNMVEPKSTERRHLEAGSLIQSRRHKMLDQEGSEDDPEGSVVPPTEGAPDPQGASSLRIS